MTLFQKLNKMLSVTLTKTMVDDAAIKRFMISASTKGSIITFN